MAGGAGGSADGGALSHELSATLRQRVDPTTGEVLFSIDQVRDIVRRAVDEKERNLREQYDRILQQKLQGARRMPLVARNARFLARVPAVPSPPALIARSLALPPSRFAEQYQAFAKFNEDYISRTVKSNELFYVS